MLCSERTKGKENTKEHSYGFFILLAAKRDSKA
jgi:hypothetical protein